MSCVAGDTHVEGIRHTHGGLHPSTWTFPYRKFCPIRIVLVCPLVLCFLCAWWIKWTCNEDIQSVRQYNRGWNFVRECGNYTDVCRVNLFKSVSVAKSVQRRGYRTDDRGSIPGRGNDGTSFSSPPLPHRLWSPPNLLSKGDSYAGGKAARAWSWPLTSIYWRV